MQATIIKLSLSDAKEPWDRIVKATSLPMPFFSYDWYCDWISTLGSHMQPYILLINNTTIAPFVRDDDTIYFTDYSSGFDDLIGPVEGIWPQILAFIKQDGVKKAVLRQIPQDSETVAFFNDYSKNNTNCTVTIFNPSPFIPLPETFDEYLAKIKSKRRKYNKFEKDFPGTHMTRSPNPEENIDTLFALMKLDQVKEMNEQKETFFRKITSSCKQYIWMQLLTLSDEVIAVLYMFTHNQKIMFYISGYDKQKYPNIGTFAVIAAIKQAIQEGYKEFSLLKGNQPYKYELGAQDFLLYTVEIAL